MQMFPDRCTEATNIYVWQELQSQNQLASVSVKVRHELRCLTSTVRGWRGLGSLERRVAANEQKVILSDRLYETFRVVSSRITVRRAGGGQWMLWWVGKWCESYAAAFAVTTPIEFFWDWHYQNPSTGDYLLSLFIWQFKQKVTSLLIVKDNTKMSRTFLLWSFVYASKHLHREFEYCSLFHLIARMSNNLINCTHTVCNA